MAIHDHLTTTFFNKSIKNNSSRRRKRCKTCRGEDMECQKGCSNEKHSSKPIKQMFQHTNMLIKEHTSYLH